MSCTKEVCGAPGYAGTYSIPNAKVSCCPSNAGEPLVQTFCPNQVAPCPPDICELSPTAQVIVAIVSLGNTAGSSAAEIADYVAGACQQLLHSALTESGVQQLLTRGTSRGIFCPQCGNTALEAGRYLVNGQFASLPSNHALAKELGPRHQICLRMYCD